MKTIILGLGNALLKDDAIGLILVKELSERVNHPEIEFKTSEKVGLNLIEYLEGYERAIIIDSIITGQKPPGEIIEFSLDQLPASPRLRSPHDADFKSAVELAKRTGLKMPERIMILGIVILDNLSFEPELTEELSFKIPHLVDALLKRIIQEAESQKKTY